jgi:hypothetical protein
LDMSRRSAECGGGSVGRGVHRWWCNPIPNVVLAEYWVVLLGPAAKLLRCGAPAADCVRTLGPTVSLSRFTHRNTSIGAVLFFCQLAALVAGIVV